MNNWNGFIAAERSEAQRSPAEPSKAKHGFKEKMNNWNGFIAAEQSAA